MESGERLTSQSSTSSPAFPATSSTSVVPKAGLSSSGTSLSSTITSCGHLFRTASDQLFNLSTVSSAFSMVSHPIFGLHTASSGHSEFGGLGAIGTPMALSAHPQLSPFQEWWRTADAHTRTGTTFFPPLLSIQPFFTPIQNHESISLHTKTTGTNGVGVAQEGINGVMNGNIATSLSTNCAAILTTATASSSQQVQLVTSAGDSGKGNQGQKTRQILDARVHKMKDKKQTIESIESSSNSDSDSLLDSSSEGLTSSDSDDVEDDQSIEESDGSDSELEVQSKKSTNKSNDMGGEQGEVACAPQGMAGGQTGITQRHVHRGNLGVA